MAARATITFKNLEQVLKQLEQYGEEKDDQVGQAVEKTTYQVADRARENAPKGTLRRANTTTSLARSITPEMTGPKEGRVFTNIPYALINEFGFSGTQQVRAHTRTITQVFGRRIQPKDVLVKAHPRVVNRRGTYYMTRAAEYGETQFLDNIREAVR